MLHDPVQALRDATRDLLYSSETDAPFSVFTWRGTSGSAAEALQQYVEPGGPQAMEVPPDQFFEELSESDDAERFTQMQQVLAQELHDLHVFRVGDGPTVEIYLVGRTAAGEWAGLRTKSVET
jgi:hypothetical protein